MVQNILMQQYFTTYSIKSERLLKKNLLHFLDFGKAFDTAVIMIFYQKKLKTKDCLRSSFAKDIGKNANQKLQNILKKFSNLDKSTIL